jgi:hypothetical protein
MTPAQLREWCDRAFYQVESSVAHKLVVPANHVSEEIVRDAFKEGLTLASPPDAPRVGVETDAAWDGNVCLHCGIVPGGPGRKIQHDVHVAPGADPGLLCEAKWLKQRKADEIAKDIWKLALSRGLLADANARRCLLLVGGEAQAVHETAKTLEKNGVVLPFGETGKQGRPSDKILDLRHFMGTQTGRRSLTALLSRGTHHRTPPDCWERFRIKRLNLWVGQAGSDNWKVGLFEMDRIKRCGTNELPSADMTAGIARKC